MRRDGPSVAEARRATTRLLRRLVRRQAELDKLAGMLESELTAVRDRYAARMEVLRRHVARTRARLEDYSRTQRHSLLPDGRKSLSTPFGRVGFRRAEVGVVLHDDASEATVCAALRTAGLAHLVRVRDAVDRRAVRCALKEGRLHQRELGALGLELIRQPDLFTCTLRREGSAQVGRART